MSHQAGHGAYKDYKNQASQSDFLWNMRKQQIREHARDIREKIGRGTPNDYLAFGKGMHKDLRNYKGIATQLERNLFSKSAYDLYKSPQSRELLKEMHAQIRASILAALEGTINAPEDEYGGGWPKTQLLSPQMLHAGFQRIAKEESRYRKQQAKQRSDKRVKNLTKDQPTASPTKYPPNYTQPPPDPYVRTPGFFDTF